MELRRELARYTEENFTLLDKIDNLKQLYNSKMDAVEELQANLEEKIVENERLQSVSEQKQSSIECHLNEIDELKKKLLS